MPDIDVDLSEAVSGEPVPEGVYELVCEKAPELKTSKEGNPVLQWILKVVGTEGNEEFDGRTIPRRTPLTGAGAGFTRSMCEGLGIAYEATYEIPGDPNSKLLRIKFNTDNAIGKRTLATVIQRSFQRAGSDTKDISNELKSMTPIAV
jgi:hypothetical protein